jgi:hypothetical protein
MAPVLLLVVLAQGGEPRVIVVPVPMPGAPAAAPVPPPPSTPLPPPAPATEPIPPPMTPEPEAVDAGVLTPPPPTMLPQAAPLAQPLPPQPLQPVPVQPAAPHDAGTPAPVAPLEAPPPPQSGLTLRAGIEACINSWPQGNPQDLLFCLRPLVSFDAGEDFGAELGATFNLLVFDDPPDNRSRDIGGFLRREDWDEPSDFGQLFRSVRIGKRDGNLWARIGAVRLMTLGNGHLINRYSNQDLADYHPAAGNAGFRLGAVRGEFFASDIFGARIFAGLAGLEFGRLLSNDAKWYDRFWLTLEFGHDIGSAGGPECPADDSVKGCPAGTRLKSPTATLLELDFAAALYRSAQSTVQLVVGGGTRIADRADFGALAGMTIDTDLSGFQIGAKLEGRKQGGVFRFGYIGPQYEVSRFAGAGLSGVPLGEQLLPDGWSVYGELRLGSRGAFVTEAAVEYFTFGRTDLDLSFQAEFLSSRVVTSLRFAAVALGVFPRFSVGADARVRLFKALYVMGAGGTVFFVQPDSSLQRGVFVSAGAGVDFETAL